MYRPLRPRAAPAAEMGFHEAVAWSSQLGQVPQGFEDSEASFDGQPSMHVRGFMPRALMARCRRGSCQLKKRPLTMLSLGLWIQDPISQTLQKDVQESQDVSPTTGMNTEHAVAAGKGSQERTKNFRDEEGKLLVSAWLNVGMDLIQGVDQSQMSYWTRIHDYFHEQKTFSSDRTQGSLMNCWSAIQHDVNVFCGCLTRIEDRNHSGWSVDDKIAHACILFKAEEKKHRKFALMH